MRVTFRPACPDDAELILPRLRLRDYAEIAACGDPLEVIDRGLANSLSAWAVEIDAELAVLWGLRTANILDDRVYLWMIATPAVERHPVVLGRYSRAVVARLLQHYSLLYGEVQSDYATSLRWLRWLGARVDDAKSYRNGHVRSLVWQLPALG
jgi:hypothetical protein